MDNLDEIADGIRSKLEAKNSARDQAITQSRAVIRQCANTIRSIHREEWGVAEGSLEAVRRSAADLVAGIQAYPDLIDAGYVQDALKEVVEAFVTYALIQNQPLPSPLALAVPEASYLNGLAEAASELRRTILDIIRRDHNDEAERLLDSMDVVYNTLMTFDYPDAVTGGLRHRVDNLRSVLERTRGDLTNSIRQQKLQIALSKAEERAANTGEG